MTASLSFAALCLVPGVPLALLLRRRPDVVRFGDLVVEALLLGLGWWLVLGLGVAHVDSLSTVALLGPTLAVSAVALASARWRGGGLVRMARPRPTWVGAATVVAVAAGLWIRRDPFYLVYQTTDMSEYVRAGNALAAGGDFSGWFVRLFQVPLALSSFTFGQDSTVAVLPFLGLLVPVTAASIVIRLGFAPVVGVGVLVLGLADPVAVWFSRFPASETLYAVLLSGLVLFTTLAVRRHGFPEAVVAGVFAGLLMLTRGNAVLLFPLLLVAAALCAPLVPRPAFRVVLAVAVAGEACLYAAFIYDAVFQRAYFLDDQLTRFVPASVFGLFDSIDRPGPALAGGVALAVVTLGLAAALQAVNGRVGPPAPGRWQAAVLPLVAVLFVLALATRPTSLVDGLGRWGIVVAIAGAVGLGLAATSVARARMVERPDVLVAVVLCVLVAGTFSLFFVARLGAPRRAPYHLYWDRYLFSEVFPAFLVMAAWAIDAARRALARLPGGLATAGLAVVVAAGAGQAWATGAEARQRDLFDDAYPQVVAFEALLPDPDLPLVYSGLGGPELGSRQWFHTNTFRVFATPLVELYGRRLLNAPASGLDGDPIVDARDVAGLLDPGQRAYLLRARWADGRPPSPGTAEGLRSSDVGSFTFTVPVLDRQPDPADERWRVHRVTIDVMLVQRTGRLVT